MPYKDFVVPRSEDAVTPEAGQIVSIHYTASFLGSGEVIETTGSRPFTLLLGDRSEPLFSEALSGMKVGGKRTLRLAPGTKFAASEANQTIEFEFELVGIESGAKALAFNLVRNTGSIVNAAILLSFAPDILRFLHLLPAPDAAAQLNAAFGASGFGAVDILNGATASAPVVADAANQWAVQGLQGLL